MIAAKSNVHLLGSGEVETIGAYNLAFITAVLKSNFEAVEKEGLLLLHGTTGLSNVGSPQASTYIGMVE